MPVALDSLLIWSEDRCDLNYNFEQIPDCFSPFTGRKADIHYVILSEENKLEINFI
ncbi:hypothetical protein SAMN06265367_102798 [Algoriphagus winogradskyi]|uniref:Uncharacterized protein n=1 Tax=Algoriphagus winogradskyi TaxID=237017 RepID=A0ABY1NTG0_9BACT|nr:hypothetical protein SAMN06265367_102798 [Algoriphagus winogradskyi]